MTSTDARRSSGDRPWAEAAATTLGDLAGTVRRRAKRIHEVADEDAVHDLRTATRRLRTAITIYGNGGASSDRMAAEKELKRVARRLGTVRDLDILLEAIRAAGDPGSERIEPDDLAPLRLAWEDERRRGARRLMAELDRDRFRTALRRAERLVKAPSPGLHGAAGGGHLVERVAHRAPALIWDAAGAVLAYELDPLTADPAAIHEMRIAAKKLRYTLEAFEDALEPGASLIASVTALQDAGGEMHDAIVARDRAREFAAEHDRRRSERTAIRAFGRLQDRRAASCRPRVATCLALVRGRRFRASLGRAVAGMGHIANAA